MGGSSLFFLLFSFKEKPKMTFFPREEILSVSYDSEVNVECKATGLPRPSVMLFINALRAYTIASARSMMAPYEANVTLVVKMTSEVECHVTNRLGSSVVRMRIVMKGVSANSFVVTFHDLLFNYHRSSNSILNIKNCLKKA